MQTALFKRFMFFVPGIVFNIYVMLTNKINIFYINVSI